MLRHDLSAYSPMTDEEMRSALYFAVRLHLDCLPQLKGKGKVVGAEARDWAARRFADEIAKHLLRANAIMMKGPPVRYAVSSYKAE